MFIFAGAFVFLSLACSRSKSHPPTYIEMDVRHEVGSEPWSVTWRFATPVMGIRFIRQKDFFRSRTWKVKTGGVKFRKIAAGEALVSDVPLHEITVHFASVPVDVVNDYAFLMPFSDEGAVIFMDHLHAVPFSCVNANCLQPGGMVEVTSAASKTILRPHDGEGVLVGETTYQGTIAFDRDLHGMVYFGKQKLRHLDGFDAVLDPALPEWLQRELRKFFPLLLDLFARSSGFPLEKKPILFVPYALAEKVGLQRTIAGVVDHQLAISLQGGRWLEYELERREEILHLLAHETFHLWNANRFQSPDVPGGAWLHEGAAEAIAYRVLFDLGVISRRQYVQSQNEVINRCIVGRDIRMAVRTLVERRRSRRVYYDCGAALHFVLSLAPGGERHFTLYDFWARMFAAAETNQRVYTHDMFLEAASGTRGGEFGNRLRDFVSSVFVLGPVSGTTSGGTEESMRRMLAAVDIRALEETPQMQFPSWYQRLLAERVMEMLIDRDCRGHGLYSFSEGGVEIVGAHVCANIKDTQKVEEVEDRRLFAEGVFAYDDVQESCSMSPEGKVVLRVTNGSLALSCVQMARRPKYISFDPSLVESILFR